MLSHKKIGAITFIANNEFPKFLGYINTQNNFELLRVHDYITKAIKFDLIYKPVIQYINEQKLLTKKLLTRGASYITSVHNGNVSYYERDSVYVFLNGEL